MKRIVCSLLSVVMLLSISGCVGKVKMPEEPQNTENVDRAGNVGTDIKDKNKNEIENINYQSPADLNIKERLLYGIKKINPSDVVDTSLDVFPYEDKYDSGKLPFFDTYEESNAFLEKYKNKFTILDYDWLEFFKSPKDTDKRYAAFRQKHSYTLLGTSEIKTISDLTPENIILYLQKHKDENLLNKENFEVDVMKYQICSEVEYFGYTNDDNWNLYNFIRIYFKGKKPQEYTYRDTLAIAFDYTLDNKLKTITISNDVENKYLSKLFIDLGLERKESEYNVSFKIPETNKSDFNYSKTETIEEINGYTDVLDYQNNIYDNIGHVIDSKEILFKNYTILGDYTGAFFNSYNIEMNKNKNNLYYKYRISISPYSKKSEEYKNAKKTLALDDFSVSYTLTSETEDMNYRQGKMGIMLTYDYLSTSIEQLEDVLKILSEKYNIQGLEKKETENFIHYANPENPEHKEFNSENLMKIPYITSCRIYIVKPKSSNDPYYKLSITLNGSVEAHF